MAYKSLVEAFAQPGYNPASDKALQEQIARELGLLSQFNYTDLSGNSETRFGIDPSNQAKVLQEIQRRHSESLVPQELRQSYAPINYGIGTDVLRDAQGRTLGKYMLGEDGRELDGTVKNDSSVHYAPWDILQKYPQLGGGLAYQFQQAKDPIGDFLQTYGPLAVGAIMTGGAMGVLPGAGGAAAAGAGLSGAELAALIESGTVGTAGAALEGAALGSAAAGGTAAGGLYDGFTGGGLKVGTTASGTGMGGFGSGLTPGVSSSGASMGGLGGGVSGTAAGTSLAPGFFAAESLAVPLAGGLGASSITIPPGTTGTLPGGIGATGGKSFLDQVKEIGKDIAPFAPLLGAVGGGLLGASSGSAPAGSITIEEGIPDWLKGYVMPALDRYSTELQNYQIDPYGVMPAAAQQFKNTIDGQFLDPSTNKYLPEYFRLGAERIKGTLSPSFGHMQAFGSHSGYNEALSRGLGDFATGLYGGAYERERDRQNQMIGIAPNFLTSASQAAFAPYNDYFGAISGLGKKKEQPYFDNQLGNILGGALSGYGLSGIFK